MEIVIPVAIHLGMVTLVLLGHYLRARQLDNQEYLLPPGPNPADGAYWEAGIEAFSGTVGATNVTRLYAGSLPGFANTFVAKSESEAAPVLAIPLGGGKWAYWRTDWREMPKMKL